jgi:ATP-binding cassette subfamily C protein
VRNVSFSLAAGQALGIVGASASGKSSLARALVGLWPPLAGKVALDGADIRQWHSSTLGRHLGYLPQGFSLFDGTIAQNISRFDRDADPAAILAAARAAGFHSHLLNLPAGYDTRIGSGGVELSAGQRQRLALAQALYREPFLVVLDEPNSNLDAEGEQALKAAIAGIRARGGIAVVIAHHRGILAAVDQVLVLRSGECIAFGPRDTLLGDSALSPNPPLRAVQAAGS